jgi:hypothetical protein
MACPIIIFIDYSYLICSGGQYADVNEHFMKVIAIQLPWIGDTGTVALSSRLLLLWTRDSLISEAVLGSQIIAQMALMKANTFQFLFPIFI